MLYTLDKIDHEHEFENIKIHFDKDQLADSWIDDFKNFGRDNKNKKRIIKVINFFNIVIFRFCNIMYRTVYYYFMPLMSFILVFNLGHYHHSNRDMNDPNLPDSLNDLVADY